MSLRPHQVRDLIIDTEQKTKLLEEKRQSVIDKIKKRADKLRAECSEDSYKDIDKVEKDAISEQEETYKKGLALLKKFFLELKTDREQMLKDLELPPDLVELDYLRIKLNIGSITNVFSC